MRNTRRLPVLPVPRSVRFNRGALIVPPGSGFRLKPSIGVPLEFKSIAGTYLRRMKADNAPRRGSASRVRSRTRHQREFDIEVRFGTVAGAPEAVAGQAYRLNISAEGVVIEASQPAGLRYAFVTLHSILRDTGGRLPLVDIMDWPDFEVRGVMLDVSRDKVPTMSTLRKLIELFASLKYNQLQLYIEHTFQYRGHPEVWRGASPLTPSEIRRIDRLCRANGIELVPNQNSFGHMERWLKHDRYAPLAEYDGPYQAPWGEMRTLPTTLNPLDPRSIKLVESMYSELLPCFSSRTLNVGCDEPFELGQGKSRKRASAVGAGRVYFDFLMKIRRAAARHGRKIQFWSDWIQHNPELIGQLPRDVTSLVWGYEADHPFALECARAIKAGVACYVCPGTSSWCSIAGRTTNMLKNLEAAARIGLGQGATGYLVTDWGDYGHRQTLPVSYGGFLYGAAVSWCRRANHRIDLGAELDRVVFKDAHGGTGDIWLEAGRIHELSGVLQKNRSVLFNCMANDLTKPESRFGVSLRAIDRMERRLDSIRNLATRLRPQCDDAALVRDELKLTLAVLDHAIRRLRHMHLDARSPARRRGAKVLAKQIRTIMSEHQRIWRLRNRPGGLIASLGYYRTNLSEYDSEG